MKYLIPVFVLLINCSIAKANDCETIYENDFFTLCAIESEEGDFIRTVYDIFAIHNISGVKNFISQEIYLNEVSKITQVNSSEYFYKAYLGGNSPPSEHRHVLLILGSEVVINGGIFSGYSDIDNDQNSEYFKLELSKIGPARAFDQYQKQKLIVINSKLMVLK